MSRIVLDASALLAVLNQERGAERLTPGMMSESVSSTVSLAEVQGKLVGRGMESEDAWEATLNAVGEVLDFTAEHAKLAGSLVRQTRPRGLSLGDRACLAVGIALKAPVYTADATWRNLNVGVPIHVIR